MVTVDVYHTWCGFSVTLECRSETCCAQLTENTARKNDAKNRHLGTISQICRAISLQLRHVSTIGKKPVKQQYLLLMSPQYELQPTSGWYRFVSLGHPCKFQPVLPLGSVTAQQSSSARQPNFAALDRGRHLYSAGRPSRWALAHISSSYMPLVHILKDQIVQYFVSRMHVVMTAHCWIQASTDKITVISTVHVVRHMLALEAWFTESH